MVCDFYKAVYVYSPRISKRDRFGIYLKIENICLEIMDLIIEAALESKSNKIPLLLMARVKIEKLKKFFHMMHELKIIDTEKYLKFETDLQKISKDANNWLAYLKNPGASKNQQLFENPANN
jgi:hypothetical protein